METTGDPTEFIKRFGLTEIYTPVGRALVDVIFVHGLDGHPYHTWASEATKTFWPAKLLPPILKEEEARILVYGYNADVTPGANPVSTEEDKQHRSHCKLLQNYDELMKDSTDEIPCLGCENVEASDELRTLKLLSLKSKDKIHNHAELLIAELWANRRKQKATERPIIFVAHSLGGLIVKRALVASSAIRGNKTDHLRSIYVSTYGILFLGTPHRGFDIQSWISRWKPKPSSVRYPKHIDFRPQIVHSLGIKNETLENIERQFIQLSNKIRIYFFYEGKPTNINGIWHYVVDEESAAPIIQDVERTSIQQDHAHMCQFESECSPGFCVVTETIKHYAAEAPKKIRADWQSERAEADLRTEAQVRELCGDDLNHTGKAVGTSAGRVGDLSSASGSLDGKSRPVLQQKRYYIVPRRRVEHFVGRKTQLRKISSHFATGSRNNRPQVLILHALGGQGKSQIAIEYCQISEEQYAGIFWVNASSEDLAVQSYARIAAALSGNSSKIGDGDTAVNFVTSSLKAWDQKWLLIFDNYDKPEIFSSIQKFIPEFGQGHIIFTSRRNQDLNRLGSMLEIPAMDVDEGVSLLLHGDGHQNGEQHFRIASEIVHRLGGLPLAIDQAAAYIRYQRLPLDQLDTFLTLYDLRREEILSHIPPYFWEYGTMQIHGEEERNKALSAFTTWEMSLEQLKTDDSLPGDKMTHFLTLSAFFNLTRIEEWLFRHQSERHRCIGDYAVWKCLFNTIKGENDEDFRNRSISKNTIKEMSSSQKCECCWDSDKYWKVLSKFCELSLIQSLESDSEGAIFSLHPLIRDWLQLRERKEGRQSMTTESVAVVVASLEMNKSQPMSLEQTTSLLAHIDACVMSDDQYTEEHHRLGYDIQNCGNAFSLAEFNNIQGRFVAAEKLFRKISATQTRSLGMEHEDTLATNTSWGGSLLCQGNFDEAERILRQTVQLQKRVLDEENQSTLFSLQSLALTFKAQHKYSEAENILRQLLQAYEKNNGKRHAHTLYCSNMLADTLRLQGKLAEAEKMQRETLQLSETMLGGQHRDTIDAMLSLAFTLHDQCKYEEAELLGRKVLQLSEGIHGKQHPRTLSIMRNVAVTLFYRDKDEEAIKLYREALGLSEKVLGKNHPYTLVNMHDLAWMLSHDESSHGEAKQLCSQAVALRKEVLGSEHRSTLESMSLLGLILSKHASTHHEAESILRETFQSQKRVLGSEHSDTMSTMQCLGWILSQHESSYYEAEQILRETYQLQKRVLGSEHSNTLRTRRTLAEVLQLQGKCDDAEETSQQMVHTEAQMKTASDDSFNIESSGESAPLPGQIETSRKRKR